MKKIVGISLALFAAFAIVFVAFRPETETPAGNTQDLPARHAEAQANDAELARGGSDAADDTGSPAANAANTQTRTGAGEETATSADNETAFSGTPGGAAEDPSNKAAQSLTWLDHFKEGDALYKEAEYRSAAAAFEKALAANKESFYLQYMLGLAYWKDGRHERAAEHLNACLELKPDHTKAWVNLARVRRELGDPQEAVALCEKALTLNEQSSDAWNVTGLAYLDMGKRDEAIECFKNATTVNGENAYALNNLGLTYIYEQRYGDAVIPLERAVELAPGVAFIHNNLAVAYEQLGRTADAAREYAAAADTPSGHAKAEVSLKRILPLLSVEEEAQLAEFYQTNGK